MAPGIGVSWGRRVACALVTLAASFLVSGCAPEVLKEKPATWPDPWTGRHLYNTPGAYVYASSAQLAGQADREAGEVAREFEKAAGRSAPKGLLIVSDSRDEPVCADLKMLFYASVRSSKMRELGRAPTDAEMEEGRKGFDEMKEESGCDPADAMAVTAIGLNEKQMVECLALPLEVAHEAGWAVVLPSDAMVRTRMRKIMSDSLEHNHIGPLARLAVAPVLLAIEPKMVGMFSQTRKMVVFEQMALQQPDWSNDQVAKLSRAYGEGVLRPAMEALQSEMQAQAAGAGSQPAGASEPAATKLGPTSGPATATAPEGLSS